MCFVPEIVSCHVKLLLRCLLMGHVAVTCLMQSLHHGQTYYCPHNTKAKNMAVVLTTSAQEDTWDTIRCCWSSIHIPTFGDTWGVATLGYSYISLEVAKKQVMLTPVFIHCRPNVSKGSINDNREQQCPGLHASPHWVVHCTMLVMCLNLSNQTKSLSKSCTHCSWRRCNSAICMHYVTTHAPRNAPPIANPLYSVVTWWWLNCVWLGYDLIV
jgi:hypothetical protein